MDEKIPLYYGSAAYAAERNELEQYRASYHENIACKEAIEQAINHHYGDNRLDLSCVPQVLERFGYERVFFILAVTVQAKDWDLRISRENKSWAAGMKTWLDGEDSDGHGAFCFVVDKVNPGLTDLFLTQARENYTLSKEEKASVRESLHKSVGRTKQQKRPKTPGAPER